MHERSPLNSEICQIIDFFFNMLGIFKVDLWAGREHFFNVLGIFKVDLWGGEELIVLRSTILL